MFQPRPKPDQARPENKFFSTLIFKILLSARQGPTFFDLARQGPTFFVSARACGIKLSKARARSVLLQVSKAMR